MFAPRRGLAVVQHLCSLLGFGVSVEVDVTRQFGLSLRVMHVKWQK